jgi:hypothetical protein
MNEMNEMNNHCQDKKLRNPSSWCNRLGRIRIGKKETCSEIERKQEPNEEENLYQK